MDGRTGGRGAKERQMGKRADGRTSGRADENGRGADKAD